jgi:methionyl-tRNA formyltransferase
MLRLPRYGCINLHGSLLPKYRGAAPIQWSVAMGDAVTGNTTMLLEEGLDTGPMLLQQSVPIGPDQTAADLFEILAEAGAPLLVQTLTGLEDGSVQPQQQDHAQATLAPILTREDGRMDFSRTAIELMNRWRGFQPWPGAFTELDGKKLIVHRMDVVDASAFAARQAAEPGLIQVDNHRLFVACAAGTWLELLEVQLEGKKRIAAAEFLRGNPITAPARLGALTQ